MSFQNRSAQLIKAVKAVLGLLYVVMGCIIFLIREDSALSGYPEMSKIAFSLLLVAYGLFRLYRVYSTESGENDEE